MKILLVTGDDFAALQFENRFGGTLVIDVINNPEKYDSSDDDEEFWELEITEFDGEVSNSFIKFAKSQIDYDDSKHQMWYHESEII